MQLLSAIFAIIGEKKITFCLHVPGTVDKDQLSLAEGDDRQYALMITY
jgi:hypothetical protein